MPRQRMSLSTFGQLHICLPTSYSSQIGLVPADHVMGSKATTSGLDQGLLKDLQEKGVQVCQDNKKVVSSCNVVILSVKPYILPDVLKEIGSLLTQDHLIVSVAAGVKIETIQKMICPGGSHRIARAMPNTPAEISEGATVYTIGPNITPADDKTVDMMFSAVGLCCKVTPAQFDIALSGPGPAFVFMAIEALADGGVMMGLPRPIAMKLAAQTVKGAAALQLETGTHPGELKDRVCSPGGTTIQGVRALEKAGFRAALIGAVEAATNKARELGKE